jgi:outer membrane immunogenic protein
VSRFLAGGFALALLGATSAMAANMPLPKLHKVPPPPPFSWTGYYIGGFAGGAATASVSNLDAINFATFGPFPAGTTAACFGGLGFGPGCLASYSLGGSFIGGGTAGYNWQFGKMVTGIEAEFGYIHLSGTGTLPFFAGAPCGPAANPCVIFFSTKAGDWFSTITARLGVTADALSLQWLGGDHALIYGKVGGAEARVAVSEFSPGSP